MSGLRKSVLYSLTALALVLAVTGTAKAAAPFEITLAGPASFYPGQALSSPFTGTLTVAGIGVPNQTIELTVDGQPVATGATTLAGSFAFSLPPFGGTSDRTVRATAFGGTPLETFTEIVVPVVRFSLDVATTGAGSGTVASSPAGIVCPGDCVEEYAATSEVTLTATPASGSTFGGWNDGACGFGPTCTVAMSANRSITAAFGPATAPLTVVRTGNGGGIVNSSPGGIACGSDCTETYPIGTVVSLTALSSPGTLFSGWSGGGCSGTGGCFVTISAPTSVTATFTLQMFTLSVMRSGTGTGTVTSSPAGINCGVDCTESYNAGTMVALTAAPAVGSTFSGWAGGGCAGTGSCVISVTAATSVTATFTISSYTLSVTISGDGSVTSNPAGISCPSICSRAYPYGTVVQLNWIAAAGWTFAGWSESCSGGSCVVTMDGNKSVRASFVPIP